MASYESLGSLVAVMIITADIGGTNARMELHSTDGLNLGFPVVFKKTYATSNITHLSGLLVTFVADAGFQISQVSTAICGIPGDVVDNYVEPINIQHWGEIDGRKTARESGIPHVYLLNDFECAAYSLNSLCENDLVCLRRGSASAGPVKVIVGVGTGLGVAFVSQNGHYYQPHPSELGWIPFWEINALDRELAAAFREQLRSDTVSFENVCAGPSLVNIYRFMARKQGEDSSLSTPKDVCENYATSVSARAAVDIMSEYLGRFLSILSLSFKPSGGIYLTGGTMDSLASIISTSECFVKGLDAQKHPILSSICKSPTLYYIRKHDVGMWGAREFARIVHQE
jgi:glucokinase